MKYIILAATFLAVNWPWFVGLAVLSVILRLLMGASGAQ